MGIKDFFRKYDSVPTEKEKEKKLSIQDNSEKDDNAPVRAVVRLKGQPSVIFSNELRSSENPSRLTNDHFHMQVEHGSLNETLPDLHLIDYTNGEATFFLDRCDTTEEQAKEAALQVMQDFQVECPNVLFFKDTAVFNSQADNKSFRGLKDTYFYAGNTYNMKANGFQLHSTKNIIPDDMPFILSPDKRFLYFGPLKESEAFNSEAFKASFSNGYNVNKILDFPKLERPLLTRPLNMDKIGYLEPLDSEETKENDLSQFSQTHITRKQTPEPSKFIIPKYDSVPTEKQKNKKLSIQDNSGNGDDAPVRAVGRLKGQPSVIFSNEPRSSENPCRLTNDQFHMYVEHGGLNETLPDLHLIDTTNGEATFFLDRCNTSEEQAKEAALQVMHDFQEECPNVLFFKDSKIINAQVDNKSFHGQKDTYFYACYESDLEANGIQLHSTKNIIPDDMPFILSPDKRFLYFGPLDQSEAFNIADFKEDFSSGYNAYEILDLPKLERPLLTRPLNIDKVGYLEPLDPEETKENDLSQFSKTHITRKQTPEPSKFITPKNEKMKPTISDLPRRLKPYKRGV